MRGLQSPSSDKYMYNTHCEDCHSSDGVGVYTKLESGEVYGYCFKCGVRRNMDSEDDEEFEVIEKKTGAIPDKRVYTDLKSRGIRKEVCEMYGVTATVDSSGNDLVHYYPVSFDGSFDDGIFSVRTVDNKRFSWVNARKGADLFGKANCGSGGKLLILTEGVADCLAAKQMLLDLGKNYRVVSILNGASSAANDVKVNFEWLCEFDNIFISFDMDEPGRKAAEAVADVLPFGKAKIVKHSLKDANDLLKAGRASEYLKAIYDARTVKVDGIKTVEDLYEDALKPVTTGLSWPWESLTESTYGIRRSEIIGIGAAPGAGKTQFLKELIYHLVSVHNTPVGAFFLEEIPSLTIKQLAGLHLNKKFHLPISEENSWTIDQLKEGLMYFVDRVYLYDSSGNKSWGSISTKIRYMVAVFGVKDIILDNITAILSGEESDDFRALNEIMPQMSTLAIELNITIYFVSHLKKLAGKSHAEGAQISADHFRGSQAVSQWSNVLIGIERNQTDESLEIRNVSTIRILKERYAGVGTGDTMKAKYETSIGRWFEVKEASTSLDDWDKEEDEI